ncbi:Mannose-6-phosphate isomerase, class I [Paenibacillus sp. cl141a]|uniref:class I mannose-6-phosphate isomerase n=1 Tax=Paenibacillus sp. cl141a TaxID=1761877 RepID=UPI0008C313EE|nr:class I mannose-6-phosphate isomerase [Paenibacillus sp. cl141a]SEM36730.1 Mannose-6-phosphate isomerase, class I [Paenibacillus sp. cl141a]
MKPATAFQSYPINPVDFRHEPLFMNQGIDSWCSFIMSTHKQKSQLHPPEKRGVYITLDGTHGADFDKLLIQLEQTCEQESIAFLSDSTSHYVKPEAELRAEMAPYLTDNRAFGYKASDVRPTQYFQPDAKAALQKSALQFDAMCGIHVLHGPGASLLEGRTPDLRFYADYSRGNQQRRHAERMGSFGLGISSDKVETYKNCLFLEWPVWETYRRDWLDHHVQHSVNQAYYMDLNRSEAPVWLPAAKLASVLHQAARQPFRVKPFFAPGIWGGQYLKELCGLPEEWPNCAWSFEPIAPENTLLLRVQNVTFEVPFTLLMEAAPQEIMGTRNFELFGDYFPIRFDYLDTMQGGELSLQVHPLQEYVEAQFNEHMTQQESYYIMRNVPGAKVYLGLKEGITGGRLLEAVENAHLQEDPLELSDYVNEYHSQTGDLYLIPPGTVHCSGRDNLVLEISSTTWWFTFKIYDYLRLDADGKPRPMNPEHARHNINDAMNTPAVEDGLIARPSVVSRQGGSTEELLGQREDLLFQVSRLNLQDTWRADTQGEFVMYNLVEGDRVRLVPAADEGGAVEWGYAESFIVPACIGEYRLENLSGSPCTLIAARVNPEWNLPLLPPSRRAASGEFS